MELDSSLTIILVCSLVAVSGAVLGTFLVLRRMAMLSDAISHSIVFGIAAGFLVFRSLDTVPMLISSGLTGLLTVMLTELVFKTRLVKEDAAVGLVFPALFSLGVVLITRYASDIHIDIDAALVGEVIWTPFDTITLGAWEISRALVTMAILTTINLAFIVIFYKELKLATFDAALAAALGFAPGIIHYALMGLLSVTAVGAFDAVGAILFIGFVIVPPAAAYLLTERLSPMIVVAAIIGVVGSVVGYQIALVIDASVSGCMVMTLGAIFLLTLIFAPNRGLLAGWRRRRRQKWEFAVQLLTMHLLTHEGQPEEGIESSVRALPEHLNWGADFTGQIVARARASGWIAQDGDRLRLTDGGRATARSLRMGAA
ncbi:MAG: metal ABC transporter permease [Chloroflexota bacterium]|nr:metal ABC transporter permease [Chloroflexota bacterium]